MTSTHAPLLVVLALLAGVGFGAAVLCLRKRITAADLDAAEREAKWCGEDS